jgi:hypothetical protein
MAAEMNKLIAARGRPTVVIHGDARGADRLAGEIANAAGIPVESYPADWVKHGRAAGPIRNQLMLDVAKPDVVLAMPGGNGTADMVRRAKAAGVAVVVITSSPLA